MNIFEILFYQPTFNLLVVLYRLLFHNLGLAIIAIAAISRLITIPLTNKQLKSAEKNKDFKEAYDKVKEKYKKNPEKQKEELAKLQMQYLPSQVGGCLPMILQIIILLQVRKAVINLVVVGPAAFNAVAYPFIRHIPEDAVINLHFLGMDLSKVATDYPLFSSQAIPYIILAILVGVSQFFSSKILMGMRKKRLTEDEKKKKAKTKSKKKGEPDMNDMMQTVNKRMIYIFPIFTIILSLGFYGGRSEDGVAALPSAIALFWMVQSFALVLQEIILNRKEFKKDLKYNYDKIVSKWKTKKS